MSVKTFLRTRRGLVAAAAALTAVSAAAGSLITLAVTGPGGDEQAVRTVVDYVAALNEGRYADATALVREDKRPDASRIVRVGDLPLERPSDVSVSHDGDGVRVGFRTAGWTRSVVLHREGDRWMLDEPALLGSYTLSSEGRKQIARLRLLGAVELRDSAGSTVPESGWALASSGGDRPAWFTAVVPSNDPENLRIPVRASFIGESLTLYPRTYDVHVPGVDPQVEDLLKKRLVYRRNHVDPERGAVVQDLPVQLAGACRLLSPIARSGSPDGPELRFTCPWEPDSQTEDGQLLRTNVGPLRQFTRRGHSCTTLAPVVTGEDPRGGDLEVRLTEDGLTIPWSEPGQSAGSLSAEEAAEPCTWAGSGYAPGEMVRGLVAKAPDATASTTVSAPFRALTL